MLADMFLKMILIVHECSGSIKGGKFLTYLGLSIKILLHAFDTLFDIAFMSEGDL
jgi:hypothetical protein